MDHLKTVLKYIYDSSTIYDLKRLFVLLCIMLGSMIAYYFLFKVMIHECGHLFFGLLTGYRFISIRVQNITFVKEKGKIAIKKYSLPGSAGQCLLLPPDYKEGHNPFILYNMGGVIFDLTFMIIIMLIAFLPPSIPTQIRLGLLCCSYLDMISFLINGIPNRRSQIDNDATNTYYMLKDKNAVKSFYHNMNIYESIKQGKTYKDFPAEIFRVTEGADLTNAMIAWQKLNESYYFMDTDQWNSALCSIEEIARSGNKRSRSWKNTLLCEKLFLYIKLDRNRLEIEDLYRKGRRTLKKCGMDFNLIRVRMAYDLYSKPEDNKSKVEKELQKTMAVYPYKGEADFSYRLVMDIIKQV